MLWSHQQLPFWAAVMLHICWFSICWKHRVLWKFLRSIQWACVPPQAWHVKSLYQVRENTFLYNLQLMNQVQGSLICLYHHKRHFSHNWVSFSFSLSNIWASRETEQGLMPSHLHMLGHGSGQFQISTLAYPCFSMSLLLPSEFAWHCLFPDPPDLHGDHLLGCCYDSAHDRHHNALCDIVWHALLVNNRAARREQICSGSCRACPGDIFHPDFADSRPCLFWHNSPKLSRLVMSMKLLKWPEPLQWQGMWKRIIDTRTRY